jgi:membrane protein DedA with SNARE-associated domain
MEQWLIHTISAHPYLVYGFIVLVSFIEGPILGMVCGLLLKLGDFHFIPLYLALMAGDTIGDIFWYSIGYHFGERFVRRFGRFFGLEEQNIETVRRVFHKYKDSILIISKVTMGLGFALATLITAGIVKIPFKRYLALNIAGQVVWTGFLIWIGYSFGSLYVKFDSVFAKIGSIAFFIMIFVCLIGVGKYVKKRMSKATV